jgi:hypothetical protein
MAFFDSLRRVLGTQPLTSGGDPVRMAEGWGYSDSAHPEFPRRVPAADPTEMAEPPHASDYDVEQWRKKVKRILEKLPASQPEWDPMLAEGRALGLDDQFMLKSQIDEFMLLVRRAVADRHITEQEHRNLDMARTLIGMTEEDAESLLHAIAAEAQEFFGKPVDGA